MPRVYARRVQSWLPAPNELDLSAFKDDMCISYVFANFIWRAFGTGWLDLAARGSMGTLAFQATAAFSQMTFGRENGVAQLEAQGHDLHGKCLRTLRVELGTDAGGLTAKAPSLIASVLVLLLHASANADRVEVVSHLKGLAGLLYLVGPKACQQRPLLTLFEAVRSPIVR
jgi:hypothetical protein